MTVIKDDFLFLKKKDKMQIHFLLLLFVRKLLYSVYLYIFLVLGI